MLARHLEGIAFGPGAGRQMVFIGGPRQAGKTTLARHILEGSGSSSLYYDWDLRETRDAFRKDPAFFESAMRAVRRGGRVPWICFDEIHKLPKWKNILKGAFDRFESDCRFIVTGSARLEWFRRAGDSLAGRYLLYRLNPLTLSEVSGRALLAPEGDEPASAFIKRKLESSQGGPPSLERLLLFSGFPEPFLKSDEAFYRRWQREMVDVLTKEDVRDLTRILAVEHVASLMQLLPDRVGAPLSLNALREVLEISYTAVRNAVRALELTYAVFLVAPHSARISRAVKKERKAYFYDWGRCRDEAKRFENYVAVELKAATELWHDQGIADFDLRYVRTRDGKETDFLITRDGQPWCLIEAKLRDGTVERHHLDQARWLGGIPYVQVAREEGIHKEPLPDVFRVSASLFF